MWYRQHSLARIAMHMLKTLSCVLIFIPSFQAVLARRSVNSREQRLLLVLRHTILTRAKIEAYSWAEHISLLVNLSPDLWALIYARTTVSGSGTDARTFHITLLCYIEAEADLIKVGHRPGNMTMLGRIKVELARNASPVATHVWIRLVSMTMIATQCNDSFSKVVDPLIYQPTLLPLLNGD